jgi:tight adherence protein B
MTGWILGALPVALGALLYLFNPSHMNSFVQDPLGIRMLEAAIVMQVAGVLMIRKIVSVGY